MRVDEIEMVSVVALLVSHHEFRPVLLMLSFPSLSSPTRSHPRSLVRYSSTVFQLPPMSPPTFARVLCFSPKFVGTGVPVVLFTPRLWSSITLHLDRTSEEYKFMCEAWLTRLKSLPLAIRDETPETVY